jgi:hypothetical protein
MDHYIGWSAKEHPILNFICCQAIGGEHNVEHA